MQGAGVVGWACRSYVNWYHELTGHWATWVPGAQVEPGTIGSFDEGAFKPSDRTLERRGIVPEIVTVNLPGQRRLASSHEDVRIEVKGTGKSPAVIDFVASLGGGVELSANREHVCVLDMSDLSEARIGNSEAVLRQIKALLLRGEWEVDLIVVTSRLEARQGFALVYRGSARNFEVTADGTARVAGLADLGSAGFVVAPGGGRGDLVFHNFQPGSTPVFSTIIRVRHDLWDRLLPWRRDGGALIGPDGRRYRELPEDLSGHALEARRYDPARSSMSPEELSAMTVEDLFEEVIDTPAAGQVLSFPLPVPPLRGDVAAAEPADGAPAVAETVSPDGRARFALFDRGDGEYWLEVSAAATEIPTMIRLRYTTTARERRELLVPAGGLSASAALVKLDGYGGRPGRAWTSVPVASVWAGSPDLITASVGAALSAATLRAWERLASAAPDRGREMISQAIDAAEQTER
jgi:hypothetical protein